VLLTTQYLDEADQLADTIVVVDRGLVVAEGTPEQLKASIGRPSVVVTLADAEPVALEKVRAALGPEATIRGRSVSAPAPEGLVSLGEVVTLLEGIGVPIHEVGLEHPSLDEVFTSVTHRAGDPLPGGQAPDVAARATA
jgi:ABC-type multidrug transport system ATPase subunit